MKTILQGCFAKIIGFCSIMLLSVSQLYAQAPSANFSANVTSGCDFLIVNFTDKSTGATSWRWDFGDGSAVSTVRNPVKSYIRPGVYTVRLTVTNASGSNTKTQTNYITVHASPQPSFSISPSEGCVPVTVNLVNTSSATAAITKSEWSFGDGRVEESTAATMTHNYTTPNTYTINLTMADANGCTATMSKSAAVRVYPLPAPNFTVNPSETCDVPATVAFSSTTPGRIENYLWDFGDGTTGTLANEPHTYATRGEKTVKLTVTDANGCVNSVIKNNVVDISTFEAEFTDTFTVACVGATKRFTSKFPGTGQTGYTNTWFIDDVQQKQATNNFFDGIFTAPGTYRLKLVTKSPIACESEVEKTITVIDASQIQITTPDTDNHLCLDAAEHQNVPFFPTIVTSNGQPSTAWEWYVFSVPSGDTIVHNNRQENPVFDFPSKGTYTVRLRVQDAVCPWSAYVTSTIVVDQPTIAIDKTFEIADRCLPDDNQYGVQFEGQSNGSGNTWKWDIEDWRNGNVVELTQNPHHTFTDTGVYRIKLAIEDAFGCKNEAEDSILIGKKIDPLLYENFTSSNPVICYKDELTLYADINLPRNEWTQLEWQFYAIQNGERNYFGKKTEKDTVSYPKATSLHPLTLELSGPRDDSTGVFGVSFMPIQYECKSDTVWKDNFQTIFPPVSAFIAPDAVCEPEKTFPIINVSKKARSYKWDFGEEGRGGNTIHYQLTVDTIGSGDSPTAREWLWSSTANETDSLAYLLQWRTNEMGYTVTPIIKDGKPYLRESHDWTNTSPYYKYKNFGTYTIVLHAFNDTVNGNHNSLNYTNIPESCAGCGDNWGQRVVVTKVIPDVSISDTELCFGDTLILKDNGSTTIVTPGPHPWRWEWLFIDKNAVLPAFTLNGRSDSTNALPAGMYDLRVTIMDEHGCTATVNEEITVWNNPTVNPVLDSETLVNGVHSCARRPIEFEDNALVQEPSAHLVSWQWIFKECTASTNLNRCYLESGDSLTIYDNGNGTYKWVGMNGNVIESNSATKNPSYVFTQTGTKRVTLITSDSHGCQGIDSIAPILYDVNANFTLTDDVFCHYDNVTLTNTSKRINGNGQATATNNIRSIWDLGDGSPDQILPRTPAAGTNALTPPTILYQNLNADTDFEIRLVVEHIGNISAGVPFPACSDTLKKTVNISRPISNFSANNRYGDCPPLNVQFSSEELTNQYAITAWEWDFGDETTMSILQNPQHVYNSPGNFHVSLKVTDEHGCEDTKRPTEPYITVDGPIGKINFSPTTGCGPLEVDFWCFDTLNISSARWVFGDGNVNAPPLNDMEVTHTYTVGDTYIPVLEVQDYKGCTYNIKGNSLEVNMAYPDFQIIDSIVCRKTPIEFIDLSTSSHPITGWKWNIENTDTGEMTEIWEQNPIVDGLSFGKYKVRLTTYIERPGTGGSCEFDSLRPSALQLFAMPDAAFTTIKDTVNLFEELIFTNTTIPEVSSSLPVFYVWNFDDSSPEQTTFDTRHAFLQEGVYNVALSAYEHKSCIDVFEKSIVVRYTLSIPNVFTPNGDGINDKYLEGLNLKNIIILNRWGQTLYEGSDGWDGRANGVESAPGTYFYIITTPLDEEFKGPLTLLRD